MPKMIKPYRGMFKVERKTDSEKEAYANLCVVGVFVCALVAILWHLLNSVLNYFAGL